MPITVLATGSVRIDAAPVAVTASYYPVPPGKIRAARWPIPGRAAALFRLRG